PPICRAWLRLSWKAKPAFWSLPATRCDWPGKRVCCWKIRTSAVDWGKQGGDALRAIIPLLSSPSVWQTFMNRSSAAGKRVCPIRPSCYKKGSAERKSVELQWSPFLAFYFLYAVRIATIGGIFAVGPSTDPGTAGRWCEVRDVLTLILAGGKGTRLEPLTRDRAKPAVPFGGLYRIIDFTLSNCINSGLRRSLVLTQYKARSLDRHPPAGWGFLSRQPAEYTEVLPPQQRIDEHWYKGTADAIYQNIYSIEKADPRFVLILAGDHIYKMDYGQMIRMHLDHGADLTVGCLPVPLRDGNQFGIVHLDGDDRVTGFVEKPRDPPAMPDDPEHCLASMGIY